MSEKNDTSDDVKRYWIAKKLSLIKDQLNDKEKKEYSQLLENIEKEKLVSDNRVTTRVGPTSPKSLDELNKLNPEEIINYLADWQPEEGIFVASPEGLSRFLKEIVKGNVSGFANLSSLIWEKKLRPVYYYYLFEGFSNNLSSLNRTNWDNIISLFESIVSAEKLPNFSEKENPNELNWDMVTKEIARLLEIGLDETDYSLPIEFRNRIWKLLSKLLIHPDPSLSYEEQYGPPNSDPMTLSVNTTRGCAVHAVFKYSLWIDYYSNIGIDKEKKAHSIPDEVKTVLEKLLNPDFEKTIAIRSIFGWRLTTLAYLDNNWLKENITKIFPSEECNVHLLNASLEGYFAFNDPAGHIFRDYKFVFEYGLAWIIDDPETYSYADPKTKFVHHLMIIYWWGLDPIDQVSSLTRRFFIECDITLRKEALSFLGRNLEGLYPDQSDVSNVLKNLIVLFDWRLEEAKINENKSLIVDELREFGWWFSYGQFEMKWLLQSLNRTIKLIVEPLERIELVLKKLPDFILIDSYEVVFVFYAIISNEPNSYNFDFWRNEIEHLLNEMKDIQDEQTKDLFEKTIDILSEKGYPQYRQYLK